MLRRYSFVFYHAVQTLSSVIVEMMHVDCYVWRLVDLGRRGESVDRPRHDAVDHNHSINGTLFDVLQHRRQAGLSALHLADLCTRLPQLSERSVSHVH